MLIPEILMTHAAERPDQEAVVVGDRRVTYAQLLAQSERLAAWVQQAGFRPGEHAALMLPRSLEYLVGYFAIFLCGGVVVPIGPELKPQEIAVDLRYCDSTSILTSLQCLGVVEQALEQSQLPLLRRIIVLDAEEVPLNRSGLEIQGWSLDSLAGPGGFSMAKRQPDDLALLLHTSGTTSNPKRVMLSHTNVLTNARSHSASLSLTSSDKVLIALPMHFGYCNTAQMLTHLLLGGTLVLMKGQFHPIMFYNLIQRERITTFTGVPTMLLMLLSHGSPGQYDISSLRYICFGGGPMPLDKLSQLMGVLPSVGFVHTYGQTEAAPRLTALLPKDSVRKLGSIGKPIDGVSLRVVDDKGLAVAPGERGEIVATGQNVMLGYYKNPLETAKVLNGNDLFTQDIGYTDEEGYYYLVGRRKNIIISGGINIYPEEVEECLLGYPGISEALVVGQHDDVLGEIPVALIVASPEQPMTEEQILRYCSKYLTNYKLPRRIIIKSQLDKTYNAKIKRSQFENLV